MSKIIFITLFVFICVFNFGSTAPLENVASTPSRTSVSPVPSFQPKPSTLSPLIADGGSDPNASDAGNNVPSEEIIPDVDDNQPSTTSMNATEDISDITDSDEEQTPAPIHNNAAASTSLSIFAFILPIITLFIFKN